MTGLVIRFGLKHKSQGPGVSQENILPIDVAQWFTSASYQRNRIHTQFPD